MSGLGYRQIGEYRRGEVTFDAAVANIKRPTHDFVRRRYAWFRPRDERVHWFEKPRVHEIGRSVRATKSAARSLGQLTRQK